jgi:ABC-2 type transport system permease protein
MPVTMMQLMVFFLAAYTIKQPGSGLELAAIAFPLSSPFAMLARAAMEPGVWVHAVALVWQAVAVLAIVKGGSLLFRKRVMKSGGAGRLSRGWFTRRNAGTVEPAG